MSNIFTETGLYAPFKLQAVYPVATGDPRQWNHLPGCPILSDLFKFQAVIHGYTHLARGPILQLPEIRMRPCVGKSSMYLHWPYVTVFHQKETKSQPYVHSGPHLELP